MKTDAQMGVIANIIVGIVGSGVGSFLAGMVGISAGGIGSWIISLLGAIALIALLRIVGLFK
ncbi:MAG: GlsB/YeaQ/YmgE family stress response membrane protein, partial [Burkholderiales bacterium]